MWKPFHEGLGPQPIHLDIICSHAVIQYIYHFPKLCDNKYGGSGMCENILRGYLYVFDLAFSHHDGIYGF